MLLMVLSKSTLSLRVPKPYLRETDLSFLINGPVAIEEGRYLQAITLIRVVSAHQPRTRAIPLLFDD